MKKLSYSIAAGLVAVSATALAADLVIIQPNQEDLVVKLKDIENAIQFSADGTVYVHVDEDIKTTEPVAPPTCSAPTRTVNAGESRTYNVGNLCQASNGESLNLGSVAITQSPSKGTASVSAGVITYTANSGSSGSDSFRFTVADGSGNVSSPATASITINESSGGGDDGGSTPDGCGPNTHGLKRDTRTSYRLSGSRTDVSSVKMKAWPKQDGSRNTQGFSIRPGEFVALEFRTGSSELWGSTGFEQGSFLQDTTWSVSFSECPGQFSSSELRSGCTKNAFRSGISWGVSQTDHGVGHMCWLKPNTTYYLNIAASGNVDNVDVTNCTAHSNGGACGGIFQHTFSD